MLMRIRRIKKLDFLKEAYNITQRLFKKYYKIKIEKTGDSFNNYTFKIVTLNKNSKKNYNSIKCRYFLKIYDPRFPTSHYHSEVEGIKLANHIKIPVPNIINYGVKKVINRKHKISFILMSFVNGTSLILNTKSVNKHIIDEVFNVIKKMHSITSKEFGPITKKDNSYIKRSNYFLFIKDVFEYAFEKSLSNKQYKPPYDILKLHNKIGPLICRNIDKYVFSHKDLNLKHIFVINNCISGIIDWEWSLFLDPVYDYAVFINSLKNDIKNKLYYEYSLNKFLLLYKNYERLLKFHIARESFFHFVFTHRKNLNKPPYSLVKYTLYQFKELYNSLKRNGVQCI